MSGDRDILDQIDDVITWHGSRDAMVWTADPPKQFNLPLVRVDPEDARRFMESTGRQMQAFTDAFRPVAQQMADNIRALTASPAWQALAEFADSPEGRALIAAAERGETEPEPDPCHCFCGVVHGDRMGVCDGAAVTTLPYRSTSVGDVDVPACGPCWDAKLQVANG